MFLLGSVETCPILNQHIYFTFLEVSDIFSSIPLQHFSDATILTFILLVEYMQRWNVFTWLLHKYGPRPTWCLNTFTGCSRGTQGSEDKIWMYSELLAQIVLSSSIRSFVLHLLLLILFRWLRCLSFFSFLFVLVLCDVTARCVCMSNRHLLEFNKE